MEGLLHLTTNLVPTSPSHITHLEKYIARFYPPSDGHVERYGNLVIHALIARTSDLKVDFWSLFRLMAESQDTFEFSFVSATEVLLSLRPNDEKLNRPV